MDDSKLADPISMFGMNMTQATAVLITVADGRINTARKRITCGFNGVLPPTEQRRM